MFEECRSGSPRVKETHKWILKSFPERDSRREGTECAESERAAATVAATQGRPLDLVRLTGRDGPAARASLTAGGGRKDSELPAGWG